MHEKRVNGSVFFKIGRFHVSRQSFLRQIAGESILWMQSGLDQRLIPNGKKMEWNLGLDLSFTTYFFWLRDGTVTKWKGYKIVRRPLFIEHFLYILQTCFPLLTVAGSIQFCSETKRDEIVHFSFLLIIIQYSQEDSGSVLQTALRINGTRIFIEIPNAIVLPLLP